MITGVILAALMCPATQLVNINLKNEMDLGVYRRAKGHCVELYPNSPCLKKLEKDEGTIDYKATCSAEVK